MTTPGYTPLMTPQQQQAFQMANYLNRVPGGLTYQQWLAMRGQGQAQTPKSSQIDLGDTIKSLVGDKAQSGVSDFFSSLGGASGPSSAVNSLASPGTLASGIPGLEGGSALAGGQVGIPGLEGGQALVGGQIAGSAAASPWSLSGFGSAGNFYAPAAGALLAYDVLSSRRGGWGGAAEGALSGAGIGSYFGPWGAGIGALIGGGIGYFDKHKTTRQVAAENTKDMLGKYQDNPTYQAYVRGMRQQYNAPPPDPKNPFFGGKYATFSDYQKAGLDAQDLSGVRGNIDTFGQDWSGLSQEQRNQVTQGLIDANLYAPSKGEVNITDPNRAKQIYDSVLNGPAAAPKTMIPRTGRKGAGYGTSNYQR